MELETILSWVTGILSLLFGGGSILFYREIKKNKELENKAKKIDNETKISDSWQEFAIGMKTTCDDKDKIVNDLNNQIRTLNQNINNINLELNKEIRLKEQIERELDATLWWKCTRVGCMDRKPPLEIEHLEIEHEIAIKKL